jgi:lipoprotein signal peptidase
MRANAPEKMKEQQAYLWVVASSDAVCLIACALRIPLWSANVVALALIAGGTLSNVIDRLLRDCRVLDFYPYLNSANGSGDP